MVTSLGWRRILALGAAANGAFFLVGSAAGLAVVAAMWPAVEESSDPWAGLGVLIVAGAVGLLVGSVAVWAAVAHVARRLGNPAPVRCGFLAVIFAWVISVCTLGAMGFGLPLVIALAAVLADSVTGTTPRWDRSRTKLVGATVAVPVAVLIGIQFQEGIDERRRAAAVSDAVGPLWYPPQADVSYVSGPYDDGGRTVVRVTVDDGEDHWTIEHSRATGPRLAGTPIATRPDGEPIVLRSADSYQAEVVTEVDGTRLAVEVSSYQSPHAAAAVLSSATPH
jgi:hypothetical protein